jgi:hypothetical protein
MPRRNRVDPFGDLHATEARGLFTGNRGCLVDSERRLVRHHRGQLWIICVTSYRDRRSPLDEPRRWTPLFFLDDAVGLAAGHRPCGLCRLEAYLSYQAAVTRGLNRGRPIPAVEQNWLLAGERLDRGRGLTRAGDRRLWSADIDDLPGGTVVVEASRPLLVLDDHLFVFDFAGWRDPRPRPRGRLVQVLTPPTSVLALRNGFVPVLHDSIAAPG